MTKLKETGIGTGLRVEDEQPPSPWWAVAGILFQIVLVVLIVVAWLKGVG